MFGELHLSVSSSHKTLTRRCLIHSTHGLLCPILHSSMVPSLRGLVFLLLFLDSCPAAAGPIATEFLYPNFTASNTNFIEKGGVFLTSPSSTFSAALSSASPQSPFVFSLFHTPTATTIWSAAPAAPYTAALSLSAAGLSISLPNGSLLWSTPRLPRPATALHLLDSGKLMLLDSANYPLWQSDEHPTDTLLSTHRLPAGASLSTANGEYRLLVTAEDAILQWTNANQQFWSLSADPRSVKDVNEAVTYMAANSSGLFLFSNAGMAVYKITLPVAKLRFMKLESGGRFRILDYSGEGSDLTEQLAAPGGTCDLPLSCNKLEVCTVQSVGATCNCPGSFLELPGGGCSPPVGSGTIASISKCLGDGSQVESQSYLSLGNGVEYFANKYTAPMSSGDNFSSCRGLCNENCFCLGFFYQNSSKSCYLMKNQLGSLLVRSNPGVFDSGQGYIKVLASPQPQPHSGQNFILMRILLTSIAVTVLLLALLFTGLIYRHCGRHLQHLKWTSSNHAALNGSYLGRPELGSPQTGSRGSDGDESNIYDSDEIAIPGLPNRFTYAELAAATNSFSTKIGSGGFGEVFRGELPDNTVVAVKRISASTSRIQGKKEFCTEIAVIGSIHHVNLVRLRGFCAAGRRRRLLVYEYMNRGSLDQSLFRVSGPVLEWQERMDIAIGAARGLAYLHFGCDRKIVHCDVKPENILLQQGGIVKIADFGLAKLISRDQSGFFTTMRGTRGYLAPEWLTNSAISDRSDVYSFGMVLLEIIRGRKNWPSDEGSSGSFCGGETEFSPFSAVEVHGRGRYLELVDRRLEGRVTEEEVGRAVRVALCCLQQDPVMRPTMAVVAAMLDGTMEVAQPRPEALAFLRLYGREFVYSGSSGGNEIVEGLSAATAPAAAGGLSDCDAVTSLPMRSQSQDRRLSSLW